MKKKLIEFLKYCLRKLGYYEIEFEKISNQYEKGINLDVRDRNRFKTLLHTYFCRMLYWNIEYTLSGLERESFLNRCGDFIIYWRIPIPQEFKKKHDEYLKS
jgi:hypothetical protein